MACLIPLLTTCTIALVGIGTFQASSGLTDVVSNHDDLAEDASAARARQRRRRQLLPVSEGEAAELRQVGAVGEICTRFFDVDGRPCVTALDRRMVALDLQHLRAIPLVIGVACGKQKAAAILGAVRGGYVKSLVTDDVTATEVLAAARSSTSGADARQEAAASSVGVPPGR